MDTQTEEIQLTQEEQYLALQKTHWQTLQELKESKQETARWQYILVELAKTWEATRPVDFKEDCEWDLSNRKLKPYLDYTTKYLPAKFESSCFVNAAPDEPVFVLRGSDKLAPDTVREWIKLYCAFVPDFSEHKCKDAELIAIAMEKWPNRKFPD